MAVISFIIWKRAFSSALQYQRYNTAGNHHYLRFDSRILHTCRHRPFAACRAAQFRPRFYLVPEPNGPGANGGSTIQQKHSVFAGGMQFLAKDFKGLQVCQYVLLCNVRSLADRFVFRIYRRLCSVRGTRPVHPLHKSLPL